MERTCKFLRYLPEFGYRGRVLTTGAFGGGQEEAVVRAWEPLQVYRWLFNQQARAGQADSSVRTTTGRAARVTRFARRWLFVPDGQITWMPDAFRRGLRQLRRHSADLLFSTYPPASAHLVGLLLKQRTGLPWVADFRDSWVDDPLDPLLLEMPRRRALERRLERAVVRAADAVVAATSISAEYLQQAYPEAAARIRVIPNGYDPEDLPAPTAVPLARDPLRIVHTGSFSYSHPRRCPEPLFAAVESLLETDPAWAGRLHLLLVGPLTPAEQGAAGRLVRAGVVECRGLRERREALACQEQAHVLLLVDHPREWPASNVPGKLYEYLGMRRPVLGLCGPGMVERVVRELGAGFCAPPDDPGAIRQVLVAMYERFRQGRLQSAVGEDTLRRFHRRELTHQLARCFDEVLAARNQDAAGV